jgi:hypothetical protein
MNERMNRCLVFLTLWIATVASVFAEQISLQWLQDTKERISFKGASTSSAHAYLPVYNIRMNGYQEVSGIQVRQMETKSLQDFREDQIKAMTDEWQYQISYGKDRGQPVTTIEILPFRKNGSNISCIVTADVQTKPQDNPPIMSRRGALSYAANSVLSTGEWYKFSVPETGVYRLDPTFLERLGMNLNSINAGQIKVYGHRGGMLPELAGADRTDDLEEIPVKIIPVSGNRFEIHAYLEGPEAWFYDSPRQMFRQQLHLYSTSKCYFITAGPGAGKRVGASPIISAPENRTISTFIDRRHVEQDINNLKKSGRVWLGPEIGFDGQAAYNFSFPNIVSSEPARIWVGLAGSSANNTCNFEIRSGGTVLRNLAVSPVGGSYIADAARYAEANFNLNNPSANIPLQIVFQRPDFNAKAWPDFVSINVTRQLRYEGSPLYFRSPTSIGPNVISRFVLDNWSSSIEVWDVTDLFNIRSMPVSAGSFKAETSILREWVAFQTPVAVPTPIGKIQNQNLHALGQADYLIVARKATMNQARELGDFHRQKEGYSYHAVDVEEIYNEFSSGNADISAIRNFVKMFYDRAAGNPNEAPRFLLLFGNGNYDNREMGEYLLPSYQSPQSLQTILTYVTDDYFALLDDDEGLDVINTATNIVDIAVGRIVADNAEKAAVSVEKIKRYYSREALGDWRNEVTFVGDDEDGILHVRDANEVADIIQNGYPKYNVEKIYLDAFVQQSAAGGSRYPAVNDAIANKMFTGNFYWSYAGHGGPNGLADERILTFDDINRWRNEFKLPIFSTATCELTRFDEPGRFSAGERIFVKKDGGAIALVSTTRLVFAFENRITNENFTRELMKASQIPGSSLGDVFRISKAMTNTRENNRKFALFGDPALSIAFPQYEVVTTNVKVNNLDDADTIRALSRVTIEGEVREGSNLLTDFSGTASLTVYDKAVNRTTLRNDPGSGAYTFRVRNNILYKGRAQVNNGRFTVTFIVPKNMDYNFGQGKLSFYAENGQIDASGYDLAVTIGGISDQIPDDDEGPEVEIYLDDESFAFGGTAAPNSIMYVRLFDQSGINTSGAGLGNDITAIIDENSRNPIVLNAFYESEVGDFTKGKVTYPFSSLEKGRHTLRVKAWDVLNNSGEGYTEFVVEDNPKLALYHVLNYPNPFTTKTSFSFEHNRPGDHLDVRIEIYTVSGKLVKTIQEYISSNARRISDLNWDGLDEFGDRLGRGVYVYRVTVRDSKGERAVKYQKLVLLR